MNPVHIPADLAPDMLGAWAGPAEHLYLGRDWTPCSVTTDRRDGRVLVVISLDRIGWADPGEIRLPFLRRECRLRAADWLAEGLRCLSAPPAPRGHDERCICHGTGYLRPPAPAWHLLDGQTGLTPQESAELLTWSATSVVRGGPVIETVYQTRADGRLESVVGPRGLRGPLDGLGDRYALRTPAGLVLPALPEAR